MKQIMLFILLLAPLPSYAQPAAVTDLDLANAQTICFQNLGGKQPSEDRNWLHCDDINKEIARRAGMKKQSSDFTKDIANRLKK